MVSEQTTLVMAGSREAHGLVTALLARRRQVIVSLPEPERMFGAFPAPTRVGSFATADMLTEWLDEKRVGTVIDASHAFDSEVSKMAGDVCTQLAIRYLRVVRPVWKETSRDCWLHVPTVAAAAKAVPASACAFSNTGFATLPEYAEFTGRKLYMRQTRMTNHQSPFQFVEFIEGQPPFSQFQEQALFNQLGISHLICRNVGGAASMSKLLAARALSIPVYMVERRPTAGHLPLVETIAQALAWECNI